jgi:hypothetical protein
MPVRNIGRHGYKSDLKALCCMYFLVSWRRGGSRVAPCGAGAAAATLQRCWRPIERCSAAGRAGNAASPSQWGREEKCNGLSAPPPTQQAPHPVAHSHSQPSTPAAADELHLLVRNRPGGDLLRLRPHLQLWRLVLVPRAGAAEAVRHGLGTLPTAHNGEAVQPPTAGGPGATFAGCPAPAGPAVASDDAAWGRRALRCQGGRQRRSPGAASVVLRVWGALPVHVLSVQDCLLLILPSARCSAGATSCPPCLASPPASTTAWSTSSASTAPRSECPLIEQVLSRSAVFPGLGFAGLPAVCGILQPFSLTPPSASAVLGTQQTNFRLICSQ